MAFLCSYCGCWFRYGTTTYVMPPYKVLHTDIMENDVAKIKEVTESDDKPFVVVFPKDFVDETSTKRIIKEAGLWFI